MTTNPSSPSDLVPLDSVRTAGQIGLGSVGSGWAATYLALGYEVLAYDPAEDAPEKARQFLTGTWSALRDLGLTEAARPPLERLRFATLEEVAAGSDIIHENVPERVETKRETLAKVERVARENVLICSSSGGLPPSSIQAEMTTPWRMLVAHPFNPPHLIPLVEVIAGSGTAPAAVDWAMDFLKRLKKHPIKIDREVTAYLTNRLQFALLREAVHCIIEGVASPQSVEDAVKFGLAPRWAVLGSLTSLALAGGPGGIARTMSNFAPAMDSWWAALGAPRLTPDVQEKVIAAAEAITAGKPIEQWIAERDRNLVRLLKALPDESQGP
jgi:carnitine 3-dehydrogenase